jgi:cell division protein FtsL
MKALFKNKVKIIIIMILTAVVCISYVGLNAYSSKLQYEINKINSEIQMTSYKVANLEVKIQSATNISTLEDKALEMGLIYPNFERIVTIRNAENQPRDFATALKQNAYN